MATQVTTTSRYTKQPRDNGSDARGRKARIIYSDMFGQSLKCNKCQIIKETTEFYRDGRTENRWTNHCKSCEAIKAQERLSKLTPDLKQRRAASNLKYIRTNLRGRAVAMYNGVKTRCRRFGRVNDLSTDWLFAKLTTGRCEKTGIRFRYEKTKNGLGGITPFSPSVDRINSDEDYTIENAQIVCSMYNIGKGAHDETDFIALCIIVAERHKDNSDAIQRAKELLE